MPLERYVVVVVTSDVIVGAAIRPPPPHTVGETGLVNIAPRAKFGEWVPGLSFVAAFHHGFGRCTARTNAQNGIRGSFVAIGRTLFATAPRRSELAAGQSTASSAANQGTDTFCHRNASKGRNLSLHRRASPVGTPVLRTIAKSSARARGARSVHHRRHAPPATQLLHSRGFHHDCHTGQPPRGPGRGGSHPCGWVHRRQPGPGEVPTARQAASSFRLVRRREYDVVRHATVPGYVVLCRCELLFTIGARRSSAARVVPGARGAAGRWARRLLRVQGCHQAL